MKRVLLLSPLLLTSSIWAGFNFGECAGSGTFEQQINHYHGDYENVINVGTIPQGIEGLHISLTSDEDVDIRLYGANDDKIVHWPYGLLNGSTADTTTYHNVSISYSGYNGENGEKGHESIDIEGSTPTDMAMKAFGYKAGYATVNYSWTGKEGCTSDNNGTGTFQQTILNQATNLVGTIPPNIKNVEINLTSESDLDIQLYGTNGTAIAAWKPTGLISGSTLQMVQYNGMNIEWSGYNGTNGNKGHEYIKITGSTTELLVMKVYGYEAGNATVNYSWEKGDDIVPTPTPEPCADVYEPVCGAVQVQCVTTPCEPIEQTFNNLCELNQNPFSVGLLYYGECTTIPTPTPTPNPCITKQELQNKINSNEDVTDINTSCITDMSFLFSGNVDFNQDISGWDISNVTNMNDMFAHTNKFNQDISNWEVSQVNNMNGMFWEAKKFNQPIWKWNVSFPTYMPIMFLGATSFAQNLSNWTVIQPENIEEYALGSLMPNEYLPHFVLPTY